MENTKETLQKVILAIKELQKTTISENQKLGHAQALGILEDFIFFEELKDPPKEHLIKDIEMPVRLQNSLNHHNFYYLEDVISHTEKEFSYYRNIGRKQIYDLRIILEKYNLKFKNN